MIQKEYMGEGSIRHLSEILKKVKAKKILLVTGKKSYENSKVKRILSKLLKGYIVSRFSDFTVNPNIKDVERGIELCKKEKFDIVIAVGGGSVIDSAKTISTLAVQPGSIRPYITNSQTIKKNSIPLIAIPTTSGSGSEATQFAVVYIGKKKYSLDHPTILPQYAIIDPQLTYNLPSLISAVTGIDAFCQAVESYWSVKSTPESKRYAKKSMQLILRYLPASVNHPTKISRERMSKAAHLAGKAINISRTTACHSISYPITSYFGVSHGQAVALTLGPILELNSMVTKKDLNDKRGMAYVKKNMKELISILGTSDASNAHQFIGSFLKKIHLHTKLRTLGVRKKAIRIIIKNGFNPHRMKNNPRLLSEKDIKTLLHNIY